MWCKINCVLSRVEQEITIYDFVTAIRKSQSGDFNCDRPYLCVNRNKVLFGFFD